MNVFVDTVTLNTCTSSRHFNTLCCSMRLISV